MGTSVYGGHNLPPPSGQNKVKLAAKTWCGHVPTSTCPQARLNMYNKLVLARVAVVALTAKEIAKAVKGQKISKWKYEVVALPKIWTKDFEKFCHKYSGQNFSKLLFKFWTIWTSYFLFEISWPLYRNHAGRHLYGTENIIWAGFGLIGNTEKKFGPIMSNFLGHFFWKYYSVRTENCIKNLSRKKRLH